MRRDKSARMRKVNELLREVIADTIVSLKDPGVGFITITGVDTSPDLRTAHVFYSVLGSDEEQEAKRSADGNPEHPIGVGVYPRQDGDEGQCQNRVSGKPERYNDRPNRAISRRFRSIQDIALLTENGTLRLLKLYLFRCHISTAVGACNIFTIASHRSSP